jgi:hypothetical protein
MRTTLFAALCIALFGTSLASYPALAQQKTVKVCQDEWRANKDANQKNGVTEKAYVDQCRAAGASGTPAPTPAAAKPAPAAPTPAPAAKPATAAPAAKPGPTPVSAPAGANQFTAEAQAKARCPSDTVVWANIDSKIYHFSGNKNYGTTKEGAYMCEKDATAQGIRAAKNEKHP